MGRTVILAEKPDVGTRIAAALGGCYVNGILLTNKGLTDKAFESQVKRQRQADGCFKCETEDASYIVTWAYGHLATLMDVREYDPTLKWNERDFPFIPEKFGIKLINQANTAHFERLKNWFCSSDTDLVIEATDADREGELIFDYIYRLTGCKKTVKRLWYTSLTDEAITTAFAKMRPYQAMRNLVMAARARAIADWLIGINSTVLATVKYGGYGDLVSIGRVQTPVLKMIVDREFEIEKFSSKPFHEVLGQFITAQGESYAGKYTVDKITKLEDKAAADKIIKECSNQPCIVSKLVKKRENDSPPGLYDLTGLQKAASKAFGHSAARTLEIAQKLYEQQHISYPRTASKYLTDDLRSSIPKILGKLPAPFAKHVPEKPYLRAKTFKESAESHHAIIPTVVPPQRLSQDEASIYFLVAKSYLLAFLEDAVSDKTEVETLVAARHVFISKGKEMIEAGWKSADMDLNVARLKTKSAEDETPEADDEQLLPALQENQPVQAEKFHIKSGKSKPVARYNEASILTAMETAGRALKESDEALYEAMKERGLGTPATRGEIIEKLISRDYIERKGKTIIPKPKGRRLIEIWPVEEIASPITTGDWEYKLKKMEKGEYTYEQYIKEIKDFTLETASKLKQSKHANALGDSGIGTCPKCGGAVKKTKLGWSCCNWNKEPPCKFIIWDKVASKIILEAQAKQLLETGQTDIIEGFKTKKDTLFNAALKFKRDYSGVEFTAGDGKREEGIKKT